MSFAAAPMTSSRDNPPPAATRGCKDRIVSNMEYVSFWSQVMSAFSCRPKISGCGISGSDLINSTNSSTFCAFGLG